MFHIEVRQFPNVGRLFNLSETGLEDQILKPWLTGRVLVVNDHRFSPEKAKLTIYKAPHLRPEEIGLGRGWANVTRSGEDVTEQLLRGTQALAADEDPLGEFKQEVLGGASRSLALRDVVSLADRRYPKSRCSDRLAVAERAVWELLHAGELGLVRDGVDVPGEAWEEVLLRWETWTGDHALSLLRSRDGDAEQ